MREGPPVEITHPSFEIPSETIGDGWPIHDPIEIARDDYRYKDTDGYTENGYEAVMSFLGRVVMVRDTVLNMASNSRTAETTGRMMLRVWGIAIRYRVFRGLL